MFTVEQRDEARDHVLAMARRDARVVAGAMLGSLGGGGGDRWSDLDLGFGIADGTAPADVLAEWTRALEGELGAVPLLDVPFRSTLYRVFLLPGCLQLDLSVTPASEFGALGPRFTLLFGNATDQRWPEPTSARDLFGLAVHHVVRARFSIERGRLWQAEHWISGAREQVLSLACGRRGLEQSHGRGNDALPPSLLTGFEAMLVRSIDVAELRRALAAVVDALLREAGDARPLAERVEGDLHQCILRMDG